MSLSDVEKNAAIRGPVGEDHKARAEARLAEIRGQIGDGGVDDFLDKFDVPANLIPEGWSYNWKTWSVYNEERPQYFANMQRGGWSPVPASRHPELTYPGYVGDTILRDGMILCERPAVLTEEAHERASREARAQVRAKEQAMSATPVNTLPRDADPRTAPRIKTSVGPVQIE
jgi:hypothetical protein